MHTGLNMNCPLFLPNFMNIHHTGADLFHADGQTDKTWQSYNSLLSTALKMHLKWAMLQVQHATNDSDGLCKELGADNKRFIQTQVRKTVSLLKRIIHYTHHSRVINFLKALTWKFINWTLVNWDACTQLHQIKKSTCRVKRLHVPSWGLDEQKCLDLTPLDHSH